MNTDLSSLARTLAERLIRKIVLEAFQVAECRNTILLDDTDGTIEEPAEDAINVLLGDDFGCLDPDDPEDAAKISKFMNECEAVIREAIEKTLQMAGQVIEERIKKVADEICKGEWATANHALLTHIAIPQALDAIRSLKPVAIQK